MSVEFSRIVLIEPTILVIAQNDTVPSQHEATSCDTVSTLYNLGTFAITYC